jgi:hypothetical protein
VVAWARKHVDHTRLAVGADLKEKRAQSINDLVAAFDELQLAGELGRPVGELSMSAR